jgi:hypothetical protein
MCTNFVQMPFMNPLEFFKYRCKTRQANKQQTFHSLSWKGAKLVRLFRDRFTYLNKNNHVIQTTMKWLRTICSQNMESILIDFPLTGHSPLSAD